MSSESIASVTSLHHNVVLNVRVWHSGNRTVHTCVKFYLWLSLLNASHLPAAHCRTKHESMIQ